MAVVTPTSLLLYGSIGAGAFRYDSDIEQPYNPVQGINFMYGSGNRRTIFQASPVASVDEPATVYKKVPCSLSVTKVAVTVYADIELGSCKVEIFNSSDVSQGSVTLTDGAGRSVQNGNITGLTPGSVEYLTVTTSTVGVKFHQIQVFEMIVSSI